jgi:hypothetical protein
MSDFGEEYSHVPLQCDSTSAISVVKNLVLHSKNEAHRSEVSFSERQCRERKDSFDSFAWGAWCVFDFLSLVCGSSFVAYV